MIFPRCTYGSQSICRSVGCPFGHVFRYVGSHWAGLLVCSLPLPTAMAGAPSHFTTHTGIFPQGSTRCSRGTPYWSPVVWYGVVWCSIASVRVHRVAVPPVETFENGVDRRQSFRSSHVISFDETLTTPKQQQQQQ
jgi:hypothetical protein